MNQRPRGGKGHLVQSSSPSSPSLGSSSPTPCLCQEILLEHLQPLLEWAEPILGGLLRKYYSLASVQLIRILLRQLWGPSDEPTLERLPLVS